MTDAPDLKETQPWGYGWYDHGGKKHANTYLPTVFYPRAETVSEGPFPLYRANQLCVVPSVEVLAWAEKDGDDWLIHDANSQVGQHIAKWQTEHHYKTLFPVFAADAHTPAGGEHGRG